MWQDPRITSSGVRHYATTHLQMLMQYVRCEILDKATLLTKIQSGVVTFNPNLAQGRQTSGGTAFSSPLSWALTLLQPSNVPANQTHTELSLWVSTNGVNYSDNLNLGFDACYFWLSPLLANSIFKGQNDDGTCSSTLSSACINSLQEAASKAAQQIVGGLTPGSISNLTSTSLPGVCTSIAAMVTRNFPSSCTAFFNGPGGLSGGPPTGGRMYICCKCKVSQR